MQSSVPLAAAVGLSTRVSQLADAADPMSLVSQTDTLVVAGSTFRGVYDAAARTYTTTSPEGRSTVMTMDAAGRVITVESSGLAPIHDTYDSRGRLATVTQGDRTETYAYNAQGRLSSVTDALGRVTAFTYDAAGRLVSQSLSGGRTVAFTYDAVGNLTSLAPPGQPAQVGGLHIIAPFPERA